MPENAFNLYIKRELPLKNLFKNLHFWLSAGTPYTWARTKIFWIWFICTLEGCVVLWTCLILKKVQIWNTLMRTVGVDCVLQSQLIFSHPSFWYFYKGKISLEWKWLKRYFELLWNPALRPHLFLSDGIGRFLFKNRYPSSLYDRVWDQPFISISQRPQNSDSLWDA